MWRVFILPVREMNNPIHSPRQTQIRALAPGPQKSSVLSLGVPLHELLKR